MKKVLILAHDFPPLISIGAQRPYSWYKYFTQHGYLPTVVTRSWNGEENLPQDFVKPTEHETSIERDREGREVIRVPFAPNLRDKLLLTYGYNRFTLLRKLLSLFYIFTEHLFLVFDSKAGIYKAADTFLKNNKVDYIIATGEPFILFKYASRLSAKYNIPWVADYRDGWTTNQGNYRQGFLQRLQVAFFRSREKQYISNAALITTPAPEYAAALKQLHPGKQVEVVYNGYDEDAFIGLEEIQPPKNKFVISYAGIIYPHQNLEMFLEGFDSFLENGKLSEKEVEVNFYGLNSQPDSVIRVLKNTKHSIVFNFTARMPYANIVKKLKASHVQLLLSAKGANWLNAKVFDYLGTGQPIMLVQNDKGVLEEMVHLGKGASLDDVQQVRDYLQQQYVLFQSGTSGTEAVSIATKQYTRAQQAKNFCALLDLKPKAEK